MSLILIQWRHVDDLAARLVALRSLSTNTAAEYFLRSLQYVYTHIVSLFFSLYGLTVNKDESQQTQLRNIFSILFNTYIRAFSLSFPLYGLTVNEDECLMGMK